MEEITEEFSLQPENISERNLWQGPKIPVVVALVILGLTILASGWSVWNKRKERPANPPVSTYFVCPDGSHHGPGVPSEGVQEWCEKHGFTSSHKEITVATLVGKWVVASVEENSVQIVSGGSSAVIEFFDNGTYKTSGGCNEMVVSTYTISDSRISFKVSGTKKKCAKAIVEFWNLTKVYSSELNDKVLLLRYKTNENVEGVFRFLKL